MAYRRTLRQAVHCTGVGLHSGLQIHLGLLPAPAGHGIRFVRTDLGSEIPACIEYLDGVDYATTLRHDGASVGTVEHLLSALYAIGVDDVRVEVDGPEVPILDGSSAPFVLLLHQAGLRTLPLEREVIVLLEPVEVRAAGKWARLVPAPAFSVSYEISFEHPLLRRQSLELDLTLESFVEQIAPARTFGFLSEVEALRRQGLAKGGSVDNAIVLDEKGVVNGELRFEDEFVRHKVLDAVGDLALLGHPLRARLEAHRAGHALHVGLVRALVARPESWMLVRPRPAARPAHALFAEL